jgi:sugar transferase (PEP-CTERM system associated)
MPVRFLRHNVPLPLLILAFGEATIFLAAPFLASAALDVPLLLRPSQELASVPAAFVFAAVTCVCLFAVGLYNPRQRFVFSEQLARVIVGVVAAVAALAVLGFLVPPLSYGRGTLLLSALLAVAGAMLARFVFERSVDQDRFKRRILVYGAGRHAATIAALRRRSDQRGFSLVGFLPSAGDLDVQVPADKLVDPRGSLLSLCLRESVDEIVVAIDDRRQGFPMRELLECRLDGVDVTELVTFLERETGKVKLDVLNPSWMIFSDGFKRGRVHAILERACDIVAGLVLLAVAWPFMLLTVLAIKLEEGPRAPVLYRQLRVGQHGRPFRLMKFRSMREDAERDGKARWAEKNDARTTRVGAFIRKVRVDELPQVFNVLRGDMSFVGPRPERPEFVVDLEQRIPFYRERHNIKPGITGWAQLCYPYGSSEADAREKLQYDLYYVKNHTLLFYLAVLIQTVEVVVWGKGAR